MKIFGLMSQFKSNIRWTNCERTLMLLPANTSDLVLTNKHLIRSLEHSLSDKSFANSQKVKKNVGSFFEPKPTSFNRYGNHKLPKHAKKSLNHRKNTMSTIFYFIFLLWNKLISLKNEQNLCIDLIKHTCCWKHNLNY